MSSEVTALLKQSVHDTMRLFHAGKLEEEEQKKEEGKEDRKDGPPSSSEIK